MGGLFDYNDDPLEFLRKEQAVFVQVFSNLLLAKSKKKHEDVEDIYPRHKTPWLFICSAVATLFNEPMFLYPAQVFHIINQSQYLNFTSYLNIIKITCILTDYYRTAMTQQNFVPLLNAKSYQLCGSTKGHLLLSTLKAKSSKI